MKHNTRTPLTEIGYISKCCQANVWYEPFEQWDFPELDGMEPGYEKGLRLLELRQLGIHASHPYICVDCSKRCEAIKETTLNSRRYRESAKRASRMYMFNRKKKSL